MISFVVFVLKFIWTFRYDLNIWIVDVPIQMSTKIKNIGMEDKLGSIATIWRPNFTCR
jgi:hypothetical protein